MKKFFLGITIGVIISMTTVSFAAGTYITAIYTKLNFVVDGEEKQIDNSPIIVDGSSYLPVRTIGNLLGYQVNYHNDTRTIEFINKSTDQNTNVSISSQIKSAAKVRKNKIQVFKNGNWQNFLIKGVNIGIAKPGYFPGETAITKEEYSRWLKYIGEMNANAIRIYTLHPPEFYQALSEYNLKAEKPIYLFHGVWVNEETLLTVNDAFASENTNKFKKAIADTINVIHGQAIIEKMPGHAGGKYTADISPYVIGWILGIEWDPYVIQNTNKLHDEIEEFSGNYISTTNGSPFEVWLAQIMEYTIDYEIKSFNWQRPISFVNWPTTDLIKHPTEPFKSEDLAEINPNHIKATNSFQAGMFASYHIYPYYPNFMNYETEYINFIDEEGNKNNYAGYLNDLHKKHDMPILIAEFGVPASRGMAHKNVYGMNQGNLTEMEQGEIDARLYKTIISEGFAGGLIFSWQDEWFKRTWNTKDYDNPDRRPYWSNVQTNEQYFGLLSFDPGKEILIKLDGKNEDWVKSNIAGFYQENTTGNLKNLFIANDERYLYLRIDYQEGFKIDPNNLNTLIMFDTIDEQGNTSIPNVSITKFESGIDFLLQLDGEKNSKLLVDSYYDTFYYHYGYKLNKVPKVSYASSKNNGLFHPINLALNSEIVIPSQNRKISFETYETGKLVMGLSDPLYKDFNSLSDFYIDKQNNIIEIRIPWALLNFRDPSKKEIIGDIWVDGLEGSKKIEGIRVGIITYNPTSKTLLDSLPHPRQNVILTEDLYLYSWENWNKPTYHERLKQSYYIIQELFRNYQ